MDGWMQQAKQTKQNEMKAKAEKPGHFTEAKNPLQSKNQNKPVSWVSYFQLQGHAGFSFLFFPSAIKRGFLISK